MVHAVTLLVVILAAAPLASNIPLSALAAILVFVAWNMGNWKEFARLRKMTFAYASTLLATFLLTVIFDLTVAVEIGLVFACVFFLFRMNNITVVEPATLPYNIPSTVEAWHIRGALFFGSIDKLEYVTDPQRLSAPDAARIVILDFADLVNIDSSAMSVIEGFVRALHRRTHELIIAGASGHTLKMLKRTGVAEELGENLVPDMEFAVARAAAVQREIDELGDEYWKIHR